MPHGAAEVNPRAMPDELRQPAQTEPLDVADSAFLKHMLAGAMAGMAEHTAMYPVDTIKTRMQALAHPGQQLRGTSVTRAVAAVLRREGWRGLYAGVRAQLLGTGPAHALYFAAYEEAKRRMVPPGDVGQAHLATAAAGAIATVASDTVNVPFDTVKQRLQVAHSPYSGVAHCIRVMLKEEGVGAFFKSLRTTILMNVPFTAIHFSAYEAGKRALGEAGQPEGLRSELLAGGLAGGLAAAATTPLDVVKTRLQLAGVHSSGRPAITAVRPALRQLVQQEGWGSLWRGLRPRVLFHVPAAAVCWGTYESAKRLLGAEGF